MSDKMNRFEVGSECVGAAWRVMALTILVVAVLVHGPAFGQSTFGSVRGVVQDDTGAILPDAQVTLHSLDENTARMVKTDSDGSFTLENVKAGRYTVRAEHGGFSETEINGVTVAARQDVRLTAVLKVAAQSSTVEVNANVRPDQQRECCDQRFEGQHCDDAAATE